MGYSNLIICGDLKRIKPKRGPRTPPGSPSSSSSSERSSSFKKKRTRKSTSPESLEEKHRPQSGSGYKPSRGDTSSVLSVRSSKSPEKTPIFNDVSTSASLYVSPVTKEYEMVSSSSLDSPSPRPWPGERISRSRSPRERRSRSRSPRRIYPARSTSSLMVYLPESRHRTSQVDHSRNYKSYRTSAQRTPPHTSRRDQLSYVQYVEKQSQWNTLGKGGNLLETFVTRDLSTSLKIFALYLIMRLGYHADLLSSPSIISATL